jgi:diguanylate cyclase (GGDEF)-like protein
VIAQPPLVLVVDDDPDIRNLVAARLEGEGYRVSTAPDAEAALAAAQASLPDLMLVDVGLPGRDGYELCRQLAALGPGAPPVMFLTAHDDLRSRVTGLDAGAVDYVGKPFHGDELLARVRAALRTKAAHDTLREEARTDPLTGLSNRRELERRAKGEIALAKRHGRPVACLLLDVDGFKLVNDTFGHAAGDAVLAAVAEHLRRLARASDEPVRYGGDELALLLPETDLEGARAVAARLAEAVVSEPVVHAGMPIGVSVSVGAAAWTPGMQDVASLLAAADADLYRAKRVAQTSAVVEDVTAFDDMAEAVRPPRALVVDDDADIRELVTLCLETDGFEVIAAADGLEALELAVSAKPDVAVLDVMMPTLNGFEVATQLRSQSKTRDIPIVFLTARTGDDDVLKGLLAGGDDYVRKPFKPAEFRQRLRDVLSV